MRILLTGGAGFIGSWLAERLVAADHDVIVLDNFSTGSLRNLSSIRRTQNLKILRADVRHVPRPVLKSIGRVDGVCHLAAVTSVQQSIKNPISVSEVNLMGTLRILEAARKLHAKRFVFASSAAVYGAPEALPVTEDAKLAPMSPYGASKASAELYCNSFRESRGLETISLRYFNIYGPRQSSSQYSGVISIFARRVLRKLPLTIFGDGSQTRDFVFVEDAVEAAKAALEKDIVHSRIVNVASGREITILQLAKTMQEIAQVPSDLRFEPSRTGDIHRSLADTTRAQAELGFLSKTSLRDGLSRTIEWFAQKKPSA